jgi:Cys-rich four helix bundle protein (predicted Tat secretion target)
MTRTLEANPQLREVQAAGLSRRAVLGVVLTSGTAVLAAGVAVAADEGSHEGSFSGAGDAIMQGGAKYQTVINKALACVNKGEVCLNHCITSLSTGDTMMKDCAKLVAAILPMCAGLAKLAALETPRLKEYAKVCMDACADCEKECRKHEKMHEICKACAEACADCIKECKTLIAA